MNVKLVRWPDVADGDQGLGVTCIVWGYETLYLLYLLPSSFSKEEYCNNMKRKNTQLSDQLCSLPHLGCWEGKQSLFISSWVNYLSPSYTATDMNFEMRNVVTIKTDKHTNVGLQDFRLLFHWAFEASTVKSWETHLRFLHFRWTEKCWYNLLDRTLWQNTVLLNAVQADSALSFLEISYCPLKAAVLNLPEKR